MAQDKYGLTQEVLALLCPPSWVGVGLDQSEGHPLLGDKVLLFLKEERLQLQLSPVINDWYLLNGFSEATTIVHSILATLSFHLSFTFSTESRLKMGVIHCCSQGQCRSHLDLPLVGIKI